MASRRHSGFAIVALLLAAACGGGSMAPETQPQAPSAEINLLFMGNSHTANNDVPGMVAAMVRAALPGRSVAATQAPGSMFLEERAKDAPSLQLLREGRWSFVVLQAQEYSSSGLFTYPTDGAETLVRMADDARAVPILFPEWPRRGIDETRRIYELHASIARKQPACVAPIPQAFDVAAMRAPDIVLYAEDGNHSSAAGAFLASLVIANTMTLYAPERLPYLPALAVDEATQARLRLVAAEAVAANPPRVLCPAAPVP